MESKIEFMIFFFCKAVKMLPLKLYSNKLIWQLYVCIDMNLVILRKLKFIMAGTQKILRW